MIERTRSGVQIRAGENDREMIAALGVDIDRLYLLVFALGAGLAGFAGVIGGTALSISPGEDVRYLLASLIVCAALLRDCLEQVNRLRHGYCDRALPPPVRQSVTWVPSGP